MRETKCHFGDINQKAAFQKLWCVTQVAWHHLSPSWSTAFWLHFPSVNHLQHSQPCHLYPLYLQPWARNITTTCHTPHTATDAPVSLRMNSKSGGKVGKNHVYINHSLDSAWRYRSKLMPNIFTAIHHRHNTPEKTDTPLSLSLSFFTLPCRNPNNKWSSILFSSTLRGLPKSCAESWKCLLASVWWEQAENQRNLIWSDIIKAAK